jgi:hypothetical protein
LAPFIGGRDSRSLPASGEHLFEGASVRNILSLIAVSGAVLAAAVVPAKAEATCGGSACSVLAVAGDGCVWLNKGDKAVRFSLIAGGTTRVVTVLAPGESFKEPDQKICLKEAGNGTRVEATFAVLAKMPEEESVAAKPAAKPMPRAKPAIVAVAAEAAVPASPAAAPVAAVASVAATIPLPRAKPAAPSAYPPAPRAKPEVAAVVAAREAPVAPTPVAVVQPAGAVEPAAAQAVAACGEACPPVLFKVFDDCLWVLNLNPRRVAFEAEVGGKRTALALEAADGEKADAQAAGGAKGEGAMHMRLADPFQSSGSGIPVFRARLGSASACVKSRGEITSFNAAYVK